MNIIFNLKEDILLTISKEFNLKRDIRRNIVLNLNTDKQENFGDLSCNAALILAKELQKPPRDIAIQIKDLLLKDFSESIEKIEIAGPGFLNIFLKHETWLNVVDELFSNKGEFYKISRLKPFDTICKANHSGRAGVKVFSFRSSRVPDEVPTCGTNEGVLRDGKSKYLVEFVSANPTGPLHLGHGRNGIIGDVLSNVLKFLGYETVKEFYINDAGSQIEKLGQCFKVRCQQELGIKVELPEDGYKGRYLIDLAKECVIQFGQNLMQKPDSFFPDYAKDNMLEVIKSDLKAYGIHFDNWFSEKSLHEDGSITKVLDQLISKDLAYEKDGALWFRSTKFGDDKDRVIRKKDGSLTYIAADIAYHENKFQRGFNTLIDVLGQDHHGYVKRLKATMSALGYSADDLDVILYQLVTLKKGQEAIRMSKRAGKFVTLRDVIDAVGTDVARFFYLNRKADAHLEFDLDIALKKTDENPVYYIQYAYVRTGSLLEKAKVDPQLKSFIDGFNPEQLRNDKHGLFKFINKDEIAVVKKIISLQEILNSIASGYHTHLLSYYSLELAHKFHNYYSNNRIIDLQNIEQSKSRLFLTMLVRDCFDICLNLLGLSKPEKM